MPNYNTWGGKNNSWGNRNRKGKSNNNQEPNKLLGIFIGGVFTFALASYGLDWIGDVIGGVKDTVEITSQVVQETNKKTQRTEREERKLEKAVSKKKIKNESSLDLESIIKDKLEDDLKSVIESDLEVYKNIVILDYSILDSANTTYEKLIEPASKIKKDTTYMLAYSDEMSVDDAKAEFDRVKQILNYANTQFDVSIPLIYNIGYSGKTSGVTCYTAITVEK